MLLYKNAKNGRVTRPIRKLQISQARDRKAKHVTNSSTTTLTGRKMQVYI